MIAEKICQNAAHPASMAIILLGSYVVLRETNLLGGQRAFRRFSSTFFNAQLALNIWKRKIDLRLKSYRSLEVLRASMKSWFTNSSKFLKLL